MADFDQHEDPIPLAKRAIESKGDVTDTEVVFLSTALIFAYKKVDQLYDVIEKGYQGPHKLCAVVNAANAYVKKHGATDSPEGLALVEAIDAAFKNDNVIK